MLRMKIFFSTILVVNIVSEASIFPNRVLVVFNEEMRSLTKKACVNES